MDKAKYFVPSRVVTTLEDVPQWGTVYIRSITLADARRLQSEKDEAKSNLLAVVYGVCDENGKQVFSEADVPLLETVPIETTMPIVKAVIATIKGVSANIADAKKNSEPTSI